MEQKNYTEVLIDGTIYTLGGAEGEAYLQRVAAYLNEKISSIRQQGGFRKQSPEYQALMVELNIADDYFKEQERADILAEQKAAMEKDAYSLKHELITTQMRLEHDKAELERYKQEYQRAGQTPQGKLQQELEAVKAQSAKALEEAKVQSEKALEDANAQFAKELEAAKAEVREALASAAQEHERAEELQKKLDDTKRELEQLKAIHAAAVALSSQPPLK